MPVPFLLRIEAPDERSAERIASALRAALGARPARCRIETARGVAPGASVQPGLWDAEGRPRWLAPMPVGEDEAAASSQVLAFLESWGFIARGAASGRAP